jgi:alpha-tubulin suppressor-like RCC1 family protein
VPGIDGVRAVAAGAFCSMALKADGSLWVAGLFNYSSSGLGVGAPNLLSTWQGVSSLPPVVAMQTDCNRSLAITADGRLWVAGDNTGGALGFGDPQRDFTAPGTLPVWTLVESHAGF